MSYALLCMQKAVGSYRFYKYFPENNIALQLYKKAKMYLLPA